jgi:PAS domain S-box-containing protein
VSSLSCRGRGIPVKRQRFIGIARDILETIGDGFCAVDREWKLVYVNQSACEMWGLTLDTLIGRNFWDVFPQMTGTDAEKYLRIAVETGTRVAYETFSLIFARWLWVRVCPMSGSLTGVYWRDISRWRRGVLPAGLRAESARNGDCRS